jgi:hypothetical protein
MILALALATSTLAADTQHDLEWQIRAAGIPVGQRTATIKFSAHDGSVSRIIESQTDVRGMIGPNEVSWQQRLTLFADDAPGSFHAVINEAGSPLEVQGRHHASGWTVSIVDRKRSRTWDAPHQRIDLSTADLLDPLSRAPLSSYESVHMLSAETGEVWEGPIESIGRATLSIDDEAVEVDGFAWTSPEGRNEFWFSSEGYLVKYVVRMYGLPIEGLLVDPPPPGADDFPVNYRWSPGDVEDL